MQRKWSVYVHIPFCRQKCFYCDFPSYAGRERLIDDYITALCQEITVQGCYYQAKWGQPATIYIGGGTPSVLPPQVMQKLLTKLQTVFGTVTEFTVECNPGTVDESYFELLKAGGVNRLSLGVQSFDDKILPQIGRIHTAAQAKMAIEQARLAGFKNISLDLMYGLPEQSLLSLTNSVQTAVSLQAQHIAIYGLQLEDGTAFAKMAELGKLKLPDEDTVEKMYDYMTSALPVAGYERYEISNFAKHGYESQHNLGYWQDVFYLGVGAAAHSYLEQRRYENISSITEYIAKLKNGEPVRQIEEVLTENMAMEEFCFLALRTKAGISKARFREKFQQSLTEIYGEVITNMCRQKLLTEDEQAVFLTPLGMKYGNIVFSEFILD